MTPSDIVGALRVNADAIARGSTPSAWGSGGATFLIEANGNRIAIRVLPQVRRFVPRFVGSAKACDVGTLLTGAIGPAPLTRSAWYIFVAAAIWVPVGSVAFAQLHGEPWGISLVSALIMGVLSAAFLGLAHWVVWGSTARDRQGIRALLDSVGRVRPLDASSARTSASIAQGV